MIEPNILMKYGRLVKFVDEMTHSGYFIIDITSVFIKAFF